MTPQELSLAEDFFALLKKHGVTLTATPSGRVVSKKRYTVHMIGFNNLQLSKNCIESILTNTTPECYHLILTNNGSKDGTREYFDQIAAQFDHVTVNHEVDNTGFQSPNEKAFAIARERGSEFYCPINNDVELPPQWIEKLVEPLEANPKGAISGPFGGCSRVNDQMCGCDDTKLEFVEFSCAMVRIAAVESPKLFAPFLDFIYGEDLEIALRLQYQGWTVHRASLRIKHRGSQTAGAHPEAKKRCAEANVRNLAELRKRFAHWNKVRSFDHPIIVKRKYAIGDVLLTTPVIRALHNKYRLCPIFVETDYPALFEGNPCVKSAAASIPVTPDAMVIDFNGYPEGTPGRHIIDSYAECAGVHVGEKDRVLEFYFKGTDAGRGLAGNWCTMHIGPTTWPGKNWPNDRWNSVAQYLRKRGWKVMLIGNPPKDASILCDLDMRGQSGYKELAALMAQTRFFIGVDSFPMHMAQAVKIPVVALFGVTSPSLYCTSGSDAFPVVSDAKHPDTARRHKEINKTFIPTTDEVMRTIRTQDVIDVLSKLEERLSK